MQPIFTEPNDAKLNNRLSRSQSCPEFSIFSVTSPIQRRKRAFSEIFSNENPNFNRQIDPKQLNTRLMSRHSETNLLRIDREKTFNQQNVLDNTGELLTQVVLALNNFNKTDEDTMDPFAHHGIDLFSDESILASEYKSSNDHKIPKHQRLRARSLFSHQISKVSSEVDTATPQFTWCGNNNDIQDYINAQYRSNNPKAIKNIVNDTANAVVINVEKRKNDDSNINRRKSIFSAFSNVFKRRNTTFSENDEAQIEQSEPTVKYSPTLDRRPSLKMLKKPSFNTELNRRLSILSNQSNSSDHILENTTIADLIRAIEHAHVRNIFGDSNIEQNPCNLPFNRRISMNPSMRRDSMAMNGKYLPILIINLNLTYFSFIIVVCSVQSISCFKSIESIITNA